MVNKNYQKFSPTDICATVPNNFNGYTCENSVKNSFYFLDNR